MPNYLSPGVYLEEVPAGVQPVEGVGTSTGAFVGLAERGVTNTPKLITNFTQFTNEFGGFIANGYMAYAVYSFFAEGGTRCYVVRVAGENATVSTTDLQDDSSVVKITVSARSVGAWGDQVRVAVEAASSEKTDEFKFVVRYFESNPSEYPDVDDYIEEIYDNVSLASVEDRVNGNSAFVTVLVKDASGHPKATVDPVALSGGVDDMDITTYFDPNGEGLGVYTLDKVDEINILAIPDLAGDSAGIQNAIAYCERRQDCFFLADPGLGMTPKQVQDFKKGKDTGVPLVSSYAAIYYPWVYVTDPLTKKNKAIPPSGVIAGTYASTDSLRGVHKAPAGTRDGYLSSVIGIDYQVTKGEQDILNPDGINVIKSFTNSGIVVWGARTLSGVAEWRYVNVRRLMMYIKESLDQGTQFVVFEPNDQALWGQVRRTITAFLTRVWRDGALFGATPDEAFFVKVDEENNPAAVRDAGQLIVEVGVAPVKPAEFIVIRISQQTQAGA